MKIRVSRAYVFFVIGALLVGALTFIEFPCPIDGGTGVIEGAKGLELTGIESEFVDYYSASSACGYFFDEYTYAVKILLVNKSTTTSHGAIVVKYYTPYTIFVETYINGELTLEIQDGELIMGIPIFVEIPAETAEIIERIVVFNEGFSPSYPYGEMTHKVLVEMGEEIMCPVCAGKGKLVFTEWLKEIT